MKTTTKVAPIAVFGFNRPRHLQRLLESLGRAEGISKHDVIVFLDGSRREEDEPLVRASEKIARAWAKSQRADVVVSGENVGCARAIVQGVTRLCNEWDRAIVLEDDLIVSRGALQYFDEALSRYAEETRVFQVMGFSFRAQQTPSLRPRFVAGANPWGWATWRRAWQSFEWDLTPAIKALAEKNVARRFDLNGAYPNARLAVLASQGVVDSWFIRWWWSVFSRRGLSLCPDVALVSNAGFDASGRHCDQDDALMSMHRGWDDRFMHSAIRWPRRVAVSRLETWRFAGDTRRVLRQGTPSMAAKCRFVAGRLRRILSKSLSLR